MSRLHTISVILFGVLFFVLGRVSVPTPAKQEDTKTVTRIIETKTPSGTTRKVTEINTQTQIIQTPASTAPKLNVSALASINTTDLRPVYGISVSKQVLGPVTVGAFGLTNGTLGLSIGINF